MNQLCRVAAGSCAALAAVLTLAACGSSGGATAPAATSSSAGASSAAPGATTGGGFAQDPAVTACLKAAGITLPSGGGARPSGAFTGSPPSGAPSGSRPGGARTGGAGGGFGGADASKVQAALTACGITLPNPGSRPTATPPSVAASG
jgi:hypothetical protein